MERCRFLVKGRVQGVGFRAHCQRLALAEGLCGWAINCPDGSVEILLTGDAAAIARTRALIIAGPPLSRVDEIVELNTNDDEDPLDFQTG
ncbi:acylphosphatase [Litorivivens sp.]